MTDYIVAIDLGTSHITGIVGEKKDDGSFSVIACETEDPASCIRRGIIYNRDKTAEHVSNVLKKLERHLKGAFIDKVYIGVNGQSLRTIDHVEVKEISDGAAVTNEDLNALKEQCKAYKPDLVDVLDIAPAVYYVDGKRDPNPVGVPCRRLEAHYKLIVGRTSIRHSISKSISDIAKVELAGIIISPLALAEALISREDKELGCALVDFGGGVTSVSVFKDGDLIHMSVIPLGGNLITRDIMSLQLTEEDAENVKKEHGSTVLKKEDEDKVIYLDTEGPGRELAVKDLNAIIEGRAKEIVENVYARINEAKDFKYLPSGIVLAGCASELKNLNDVLRDKCKVNIRPSIIRTDLVKDFDNMLGNPLFMTAVSLMLKGTATCVTFPEVKTPEETGKNNSGQDVDEDDDTQEDRNEGRGFFRRKKNVKVKEKPQPGSGKGNEGEKGGGGGFWGTLFVEN